MLIIGAGAILVGIFIYALIDCIRSEKWQVRALPKPAWIAVTLLFPLVGALLWLFLGRPKEAGIFSPLRNTGSTPPKVQKAPDDDEEFLRFLDAKAKRERESQQREQERRSQETDDEDTDKDQ